MKLEQPGRTIEDLLLIDNGEFAICVDRLAYQAAMERKQHSALEISGLWNQFVKFANDVELSRVTGFALGSTDPIGAIDDQVYRYNVANGATVTVPDSEIRAIIRPAQAQASALT